MTVWSPTTDRVTISRSGPSVVNTIRLGGSTSRKTIGAPRYQRLTSSGSVHAWKTSSRGAATRRLIAK